MIFNFPVIQQESINKDYIEGNLKVITPNDLIGVTKLRNYSFYQYDNLKEVELPDSITTLYTNCFAYCQQLTKVKLPESITSIFAQCFNQCNKLTEINIPSQITSINSSTFSGCIALANITIPSGVTTIQSQAFNQTAITSTDLPADAGRGVRRIVHPGDGGLPADGCAIPGHHRDRGGD